MSFENVTYDSLQISIEPALLHHFTSLESNLGKWSMFYLLNSLSSSAALGKMSNKQKALSVGMHSPGSVGSKSFKMVTVKCYGPLL